MPLGDFKNLLCANWNVYFLPLKIFSNSNLKTDDLALQISYQGLIAIFEYQQDFSNLRDLHDS